MSNTKNLGQYPTPVWVAEALVERYFGDLDSSDCVIEPSCGPGAFLSAIPGYVPAVGVEIDAVVAREATKHTGRTIIVGDFQSVSIDVQPTVVLGNPPFNLQLIDRFLDRSSALLPEGGRVGFILPAYAFQTAARVSGYAERWSLMQEMIPRNIYPGLSLPLVFALFSKDRHRTMVGFALYREAADVLGMPQPYRATISAGAGPVWKMAVDAALCALGGEADVQDIYREIGGQRPTKTAFWQAKVRQTLRRYSSRFARVSTGRYRLCDEQEALAA